MADLFHDGHLRVELPVGGVVLQELTSAEFLGGKDLAVALCRHLVDGREGSLAGRADDVVPGASIPRSGEPSS